MSDRTDPSQYGYTAGDPDFLDFVPDTAGTNNQAQDNVEGGYASPEDLAGYPDHANPQDLLSVRPGDFYTRGRNDTVFVAVARPVQAVSGLVSSAPGLLAGINFRETTGTLAAVLNLRNGPDAGYPVLMTVSLAAAESARDFLPLPIEFPRGLYLEIVSGTITGTVYTRETRNV